MGLGAALRCEISVPEGRDENSPAVYCWGKGHVRDLSPVGTTEGPILRGIPVVPTGLE